MTRIAVGPGGVVDDDSVRRVGLDLEREVESAGELGPAVGDGLREAADSCDVAVVTSHVEDTGHLQVTGAVCRWLPDATTTVAVLTVPPEGMDARESRAFSDVVGAAGTTIPIDLARIDEGFPDPAGASDDAGRDDGDADQNVESDEGVQSGADVLADVVSEEGAQSTIEVADELTCELVVELFESMQFPRTAPASLADLHGLLESGNVGIVHWGWTTREHADTDLVDHAVAHRFCDGATESATGGCGLLRFGAPFTGAQFESVRCALDEGLRPAGTPDERWLLAGAVTRGLGDECRLAFVQTNVDRESLSVHESED